MLKQFFSPEVAVLVEQVNFKDLGPVLVVPHSDKPGNDEGEEVSEVPEPDAGGDGIVVIGIEPLG